VVQYDSVVVRGGSMVVRGGTMVVWDDLVVVQRCFDSSLGWLDGGPTVV
jgi:hypothetical protein